MTAAQLQIRTFQDADKDDVIMLWQSCNLLVPWNDPLVDIQTKCQFQGELFLVGTLDSSVVATAMAGYDGHRGWVNYLAVAPEYQRLGMGRKIMKTVEERLKALGCPKLNIQVRTTNTKVIEFYQRLGFADDNVIGLGKRLRA